MSEDLEQKLTQRAEAQQQSLGRPASTILQLLSDPKIKDQLVRSLPTAGITVDRILRVALTEVRRNPKLADCSQRSFLGSLMIAAQLGLEPGGPLGQFYLVPFKNKGVLEVVPILGYKGMIALARRSGEINDIVARPVHAKDYFDFAYGLEDRLIHRPSQDVDKGKVVSFYGIARYTNGGHLLHVMSKADVDRYRGRSRAAESDSGPWVSDYEQMGSKTVIRRMASYLPLTAEAATAVVEDEDREEGRRDAGEVLDVTPIAISDEPPPADEPEKPKARTRSRTAGRTEPAGAQGTEGDGGNRPSSAPEPDKPQEPYVCPICGTTTATHDNAKHEAWAKQKREERERGTQSGELPLQEGEEK